MTRTLFFFTCLATVAVAFSAFPIRWELAYPNVSLFLTSDNQPDGHLFNATVQLHKMAIFLAVMLLGTTLSSAARDKGAPLSALFIWTGIGLSASLTILIVLVALPPFGVAPDNPLGVGWTLYPPLSTSPGSLLMQLFPRLDPFLLGHVGQQIALPANAMLYFGVYALTATLPNFRFMSAVGLFAVLAAVILTNNPIQTTSVRLDWLWIVALVGPFLVCAAISLLNARRPWLILLAVGVVFTVAAPATLAQLNSSLDLRDTMALIALQYLFPMGLAWFALPALMLFTHDTRLPRASIWVVAVAIAALLGLWVLPLFNLGRMGMPSHYVDYPDAFGPLNLMASLGVLAFALTYLGILIAVRRARV